MPPGYSSLFAEGVEVMIIMFNRGALNVRLHEMAVEYLESASRLDGQIRRLTAQIHNEPDVLKAQLLSAQRNELYMIKRDCREIAAYLVSYYDKNQGAFKTFSTGCIKGCGFDARTRKGEQFPCAGIDGKTAVLSDGVFQWQEICPDSERK